MYNKLLYNNHYYHSLEPGHLLLADVDAGSETGWAADITCTWPVSGKFSYTQRDIYHIVLVAYDAGFKNIGPGVEYGDSS
jgi:Xaa-Pro aminopeptidase